MTKREKLDFIIDHLSGKRNERNSIAFFESINKEALDDLYVELTGWLSSQPERPIDIFRKVLGEEVINYIEVNNDVSFEERNAEFYGPGKYEIRFKTVDNKGDTVSFLGFELDKINNTWSLESSVNCGEEFNSWDEMCQFYKGLENKIYSNGDQMANIMFKNKNGKNAYI
jgi:hypothetical protein